MARRRINGRGHQPRSQPGLNFLDKSLTLKSRQKSGFSRFSDAADKYEFAVLVEQLDGLFIEAGKLVATEVKVPQLLHIPNHNIDGLECSCVDQVVWYFQ